MARALAAQERRAERRRPRRVEARVGEDRLAVQEAEVAGHERPERRARRRAVLGDGERHVRDHAERRRARRARRGGRRAHAADVGGRGQDRTVHAVGHLAREGERPRPLDAEEDRHPPARRPLEADAVQGEAPAAPGQALAREEPPDDLDALAHGVERRRERDAHPLLDPRAVARAEAEHHAPRRQARERGGLHREQRRVARVGVHDADADGDALGHRGGGAGEREGAGVEVVLDEPDAAEPRALGGPCPGGHVARRRGAEERDAGAIREARAHSARAARRAARRSRRRRPAPRGATRAGRRGP